MSTGCAVLFPAIMSVFQFFPLGGTTELVGGFNKHHLRHLLVPQNMMLLRASYQNQWCHLAAIKINVNIPAKKHGAPSAHTIYSDVLRSRIFRKQYRSNFSILQ
jgi:hypothetical protein